MKTAIVASLFTYLIGGLAAPVGSYQASPNDIAAPRSSSNDFNESFHDLTDAIVESTHDAFHKHNLADKRDTQESQESAGLLKPGVLRSGLLKPGLLRSGLLKPVEDLTKGMNLLGLTNSLPVAGGLADGLLKRDGHVVVNHAKHADEKEA
jgi:hypothetical protein